MDISFFVFVDYQGDNIEKCLESICGCSIYKSEIIIIINSCSEDKMKIINNYKEKYKNIKIIDKNISVLNDEIEEANGDYICFIHEIDFIDPIGMNILKQQAISNELDIIEGNIVGFDLISKKYKNINLKKNKYLRQKYIQNTLYKRKFIIENKIVCNEMLSDTFMLMALKSKIISKNKEVVNVTCSYTVGETSKYKYKHIIEDYSLDQLKKYCNTYIELFKYIEELSNEEEEIVKDEIINYCIEFIFNEGLNYLNIMQNKRGILEKLNRVLSMIDLEKIHINDNRRELLKCIKEENLNKYYKLKKRNKEIRLIKKSPKTYIRRKIYQKVYDIFASIPNIRKKILFIVNMPQVSGNFKYIKKEIDKYNETAKFCNKIKYKTIFLKSCFLKKILYPIYIGRANYIVLAEHIPYISYLKKKDKTKVIQTWHAAGAFKKFGHSTSYMPGGPNPFTNSKMELHSNYDIATVSSKEIVPYYAEAFKMKEEQIVPIGLPRADFFFDEKEKENVKNRLLEKYEFIKDKKVILYAPTFRGNGAKRKQFELKFDYEKLSKNISDKYVILLKLHPSVKSCDIVIDDSIKDKVYNVSDEININELLIITDLLVADYSSVVFEYSLLGKPMIFYAYDLKDYAMDRDLYYKYEEFIPGPLARTMEELIEIINKNNYDIDKINNFASKFFVSKDGNSSKRLIDEVILKK